VPEICGRVGEQLVRPKPQLAHGGMAGPRLLVRALATVSLAVCLHMTEPLHSEALDVVAFDRLQVHMCTKNVDFLWRLGVAGVPECHPAVKLPEVAKLDNVTGCIHSTFTPPLSSLPSLCYLCRSKNDRQIT
jgi:hypothetical protein